MRVVATKPLGCYGDGGAVFTDDDNIADIVRSLRVHGKGTHKYDNVRIGMNSRLDTIQAAILIEKLNIFPEEIKKRNAVAKRYNAALSDVAVTPTLIDGATSVWAQYTLCVENREELMGCLKASDIPSVVYYPRPLHLQTAYKDYPISPDGLPVCVELSGKVLSLPMHPYLDTVTQDRVIDAFHSATRSVAAQETL
ncbi:MAG: DegT/DnrJ/EryC1/StrS aminotransferase family protein [Pseudomonadota bacterium]|nr:DegT/DnrJ/EryC1/StrS aminotransferase family protein [Pseudomonadota bacterium]